MDAALLAVHNRLNEDLEFYAANAPLLIKGKVPGPNDQSVLLPWKWNTAQRWMQFQAETQRKATGGWVRLLLVKGRQQGGSTWTEGRFFHRVTRKPGTSASIIAHEGKATANLFKMVERFYDNLHPALRPEVGKDNTNQLTFPSLQSEYRALTAGNDDAGRSSTAQLVHGSEVAYWPNDYAMQDSLLETVALAPGTEIILESTGNGPRGLFYDKVMLAMANMGDYKLVFVPWYWQDEYERVPEPDFELDAEEREYCRQHFGPGRRFPFETHDPSPARVLRKMAWRRAKILDFATSNGGLNVAVGLAKFQRIYPSFPQEPFQMAGLGMIRADALASARRNTDLMDEVAPLVMGVDPALDSQNSDRTVLALRRGRVLEEVIVKDRMKQMELAALVARLIEEKNIQMVFFDNAYGTGPVDRLREMGYASRVQGVWFNERPSEPNRYRNKRTEIIMRVAAWLNEGGVKIPDRDDIIADLAAMPMSEEDSNGVHYVKSKREIKKLLGRSPDIYDAIALTFAYLVRAPESIQLGVQTKVRYGRQKQVSPLAAERRRRR